MKPVTDAFLRAVRGSHQMTARARVVETFQTGTDPDGTEIAILDGDVQLAGGADIRATLDMTTDGNRAWPRTADALLAPYGNEVFVERGVEHVGGDLEMVPLGYFRIYAAEQATAPDGPIRISAKDRMSGIVDARLLQIRQFAAGTTLGAVVDELVTEVYPDAVIEWDDDTDTATLARAHIAEEDRYAFLNEMVTASGKVMYFDHRGVLVIKNPPELGETIVTLVPGPDVPGPDVVEDFEDASLAITLSGTWARSTASAHAGTWSLKSATIGDSATTDAVVQVPVDATTLQFWYRVSSEAGFDFFRFFIDGVQQFEAAGAGSWTQSAVYNVSAAAQVTFRYLKDSSTVAGEDAAYIDDLVFGGFPDVPGPDVEVAELVPAVPVFEVNAGRNGVLVAMARQLSREGAYNAVVAYGEAPDTETPVRAVAVDNNPNSATYFYGQFGKVPRYYSSPFITTLSQATTAAASILVRTLGLPYNVNFEAVPNPALEPLDLIRISYPRAGAELHVIDSMTIPLTPEGALRAVTREGTHTDIGGL